TRFSCTNRNTHYDAVRAVQLINEYPMYMFSSVGNGNSQLVSTVCSCEYQYMRTVKVAGLIAVLVCGVIALGAAPGPETAKMRAIVIHAYGGPEVMKLENVARPERRADEVLIRVIAASINPVDVAIRKGYLAKLVGNFPLTLGMDAAGIVEKVGNKVTKYKAGDAVFAFFTVKEEGGYAEFVTAKEDELASKPKHRQLRASCWCGSGRRSGMGGID